MEIGRNRSLPPKNDKIDDDEKDSIDE